MIRKFTADKIYTSEGHILTDEVVITNDAGEILAIQKMKDHDTASVQIFKGFLCPGFINSHCHLELSHLRGRVDSGTGLPAFIKKVVSIRDTNQDLVLQAIKDGDDEMYKNGIVAVGDISNKSDTSLIKSHSKLDYYTFVEMFDFMQPSRTEATIVQYTSVMKSQSSHWNNKKSYTPHAPYTVSPDLFKFVEENNAPGQTISIHNQETKDENRFFISGTGQFKDFYDDFGFSLEHFQPTGKSSIHYVLEQLKPAFKTIFVHNTFTKLSDILDANAWNEAVYWATCPNANLFIENRMPDYRVFIDAAAKVTIGTDSLASNWQLSIWEEIKTIKKYASYLPLQTIINWATIHGAEALGYDDRLGSIKVGKTPGLAHIDFENHPSEFNISQTSVTRII